MTQRAHVVQPVRQLDQNHTDVLCHGQKHFAQVLRLHFDFIRVVGELLQFRDAIDQQRDFFSELRGNLLIRHNRVLHDVMQKTGHNRLFVQLQLRQDNADTQWVNNVRLAGFAHLALMGVPGYVIRLFYHRDVRGRMVFVHTVNQLLVQLLRALKFFCRLYHILFFS